MHAEQIFDERRHDEVPEGTLSLRATGMVVYPERGTILVIELVSSLVGLQVDDRGDRLRVEVRQCQAVIVPQAAHLVSPQRICVSAADAWFGPTAGYKLAVEALEREAMKG